MITAYYAAETKRHHSNSRKASLQAPGPVPAVPRVIGTLPLRGPGLLKGLQTCDLIPSSEQTNTEAPA